MVERYVNTLKSTSAEEFGVDTATYKKVTDYMSSLSSKINDVYTRLDLTPVAYDSCGMPRIVESSKKISHRSFTIKAFAGAPVTTIQLFDASQKCS